MPLAHKSGTRDTSDRYRVAMQGNGRPAQGWHMQGRGDDEVPIEERAPLLARSVNRFAVALALLPLVQILLMSMNVWRNLAADLVYWGVVIWLAFLDARELRRLGHQVTWAWAILLPIVHLIHRTRRSGQTSLIPWLWVASTTAAIVAGLAILGGDLGASDPVVEEGDQVIFVD